MADIKMLFENWITHQPMGVLWLVMAAALIFGVSFLRARGVDMRAWSWFRGLVEALAKALIFAALVGMVYFLLESSTIEFSKIYGSFTTADSISSQRRQEWSDVFGGVLDQEEIQVTQYQKVVTQEEVWLEGSSAPLYRNVKIDQPVSGTSVTSFRGDLVFQSAAPQNSENIYNVYTVSAAYEYEIINPTNIITRAVFSFPLSPHYMHTYRNINVRLNNREVDWHMENGFIVLEKQMEPAEKAKVKILYNTFAMEGYIYRIPSPHEISDFQLNITSDVSICCLVFDAQNNSIEVDRQMDGEMNYVSYSIDHAIMASDLGFYSAQGWPYAPYYEMTAALPYAPRAALLFLPFAALTFLICGVQVNLRQFVLLGALFMLPFLVLMSGQVPAPHFIGGEQFAGYQVKMLPVLSLVPLALAFLILRKTPRLPLTLVLLLMALAMGGYVFVGLLPDEQKRNAAETLIQACLIGYLFLLTLYTRLRSSISVKKWLSKKNSTLSRRFRWLHWTARIMSILLSGFWVFALFWAVFTIQDFSNFGSIETILIIGFDIVVLAACGSLIYAWKNVKLGGLFSMISALLVLGMYLSRQFFIKNVNVSYGIIFIASGLFLLNGFLFWLSWKLAGRDREEIS